MLVTWLINNSLTIVWKNGEQHRFLRKLEQNNKNNEKITNPKVKVGSSTSSPRQRDGFHNVFLQTASRPWVCWYFRQAPRNEKEKTHHVGNNQFQLLLLRSSELVSGFPTSPTPFIHSLVIVREGFSPSHLSICPCFPSFLVHFPVPHPETPTSIFDSKTEKTFPTPRKSKNSSIFGPCCLQNSPHSSFSPYLSHFSPFHLPKLKYSVPIVVRPNLSIEIFMKNAEKQSLARRQTTFT